MKIRFILMLLVLIVGTSYSQQVTKGLLLNEKNQYLETDTVPKVIYPQKIDSIVRSKMSNKEPFYIIDGECVTSSSELNDMDPNAIESMYVDKIDTAINGKNYYGRISIITKLGYKSNLITVRELIEKYTNLKDTPYIFSIDGEVTNNDATKTKVDEKNIMQIKVIKLDKIKYPKDLWLVEILKRTPENLKKVINNKIRIRGGNQDMDFESIKEKLQQ